MYRRGLTAIAMLVGAMSVASAVEFRAAAPTAESMVATYGWTGFTVGANAGYGMSRRQLHVVDADPTYFPAFDGGETMPHRGSSFAGGLSVGYDKQFGSVVMGAFASLSGLSASDRTWSRNACCGSADDRFDTKLSALGIVGLRAGYAIDRTLVYATGGAAFGRMSFDLTDDNKYPNGSVNVGSPTGQKSATRWLTGYTIGGGFEYAVLSNVIVGFDYKYVDFGSERWNMSTNSYDGSGNLQGKAKYVIDTRNNIAQTVGVAVKYKFGGM
ncbi:outer membrane protein [Prosthecodimorpha staleyi]|uniref:Outer membrane beta-barrel protein n=1 Tax=Prosthecodimorpha staleyi TaxID=2840188 RepID=A0A947D1B8_9HYPH|nr:outer membrane beta-barrel protein [Prosthecodimorpha staleyi]MBT9288826.1 outer membrane beta-barrel protein [Prosthecodimorpha staleyi]